MFIAHLPSGYLLTKALPVKPKKLSLWLTGIFFAAAPDIDLLWFYFVTGQHRGEIYWPAALLKNTLQYGACSGGEEQMVVWNFILHWTFFIEIAIYLAALACSLCRG